MFHMNMESMNDHRIILHRTSSFAMNEISNIVRPFDGPITWHSPASSWCDRLFCYPFTGLHYCRSSIPSCKLLLNDPDRTVTTFRFHSFRLIILSDTVLFFSLRKIDSMNSRIRKSADALIDWLVQSYCHTVGSILYLWTFICVDLKRDDSGQLSQGHKFEFWSWWPLICCKFL